MKAIEYVKQEVRREYDRAAAKFGAANNSPYESYAVILEEYEEAQEQIAKFAADFEIYWQRVKQNLTAEQYARLKCMQERAENAAAELIQVAAMCFKARIPFEQMERDKK
ncbi:MAG: hypothetical protein FWF77_00815 [Defluviitaleaceae bacterium]|nr:hypothetical protein [Defluviitaleaceae bacterium]